MEKVSEVEMTKKGGMPLNRQPAFLLRSHSISNGK
jgi:hypothetical protein